MQTDLGVSAANVRPLEEITRDCRRLKEIHANTTALEVGIGFEALMAGDLTGPTGDTLDSNIYQNLSYKFMSDFLYGVNRYKLEASKLVRANLPEKSVELSESEKWQIELEFRNKVADLYERFRKAEASDRAAILREEKHLTPDAYVLIQELGIYRVSDENKIKYVELVKKTLGNRMQKEVEGKLQVFNAVMESVSVKRSNAAILGAKSMSLKEAFENMGLTSEEFRSILTSNSNTQ